MKSKLKIRFVLSLFDGHSCGRISLDLANLKFDTYYASEIDKNAMAVSAYHYPDIIQLGDVCNWKSWDIDWSKVDLVVGGSPCQGFSPSGKKLYFEDPRSILFFKYIEILEHIKKVNPNVYFFLENVKMKKVNIETITRFIKEEPLLVNSNLLSPQNRPRLYWFNWSSSLPLNNNSKLSQILEKAPDQKYMFSQEYIDSMAVSPCLKIMLSKAYDHKTQGKSSYPVVALTERRTEEAKRIRAKSMRETGVDFCPRRGKELVARKDGKMNCITATFSSKEHTLIDEKGNYRKLTPLEAERCQQLPDNYTMLLKIYQRYRLIGNGWTIGIIVFFFIKLKEELFRKNKKAKND